MHIKEMAEEVNRNAVAKGFWDKHRNFPELLCLVHSEVSEALEGYREDDLANVAEELADIVIRVFDIAEAYGFDIEFEIIRKHSINEKRPHMHGGKKC